MSAHQMEPRLSRLEGAYEQVDKRLGGLDTQVAGVRRSLEAQISGLRVSLEGQIAALRAGEERNSRWLTGLIVTSWLTLMATIVFRH